MPELGSEKHDEGDADDIGDEDLSDMETVGSGDVHLRVAVMYPVKAP